MNLLSILFCLVLASVTQSARISKPKLNLANAQNKTTPSPIKKPPEERRQLPIFPRSSRKFIVTPLVYRRYVTQNPIALTKKPLMKKLVLRDKKPNLIKVERLSTRPVINTKFVTPKPIDKRAVQEVNTTKNLDFIDEPAEVSSETRNNNFYDRDFIVHGDYSDDIATVIYPNINNKINLSRPIKVNGNNVLKIEDFIFTPQVKPTKAINKASGLSIDDFIFTPKVKPLEVTAETTTTNTNIKKMSEEDDNVSPEEIADRNEFIFVNENNKENIIPDVPDEPIPSTETILEFKPRVKRSINVIEEENIGVTVSGFKVTHKDTKLSNNLMFKNINS